MKSRSRTANTHRISRSVRQRIEGGGERLWRYEDFRDLPFPAVAQALSRLARAGIIERLSKGVYYSGRKTAFGVSRPNPAGIAKLASKRNAIFPAGVAAANLLGFTTQNPSRVEVATSGGSLPRKLVGSDTVIHTRRPASWAGLSTKDAALLDFLRTRARTSELSPEETVKRTLTHFSEQGRFDRLLKIADTEPPRVRAILGAIGEQIGKNASTLRRLHQTLNPLSRFDFGTLSGLIFAHKWYAKEPRRK
jgi:Family of unknown function (DUF6088)